MFKKKHQIPLKNFALGIDADYDYESDSKIYCIRCEYYLDAVAGERCTHSKVNDKNISPVAMLTFWGNHLLQNENNDCKYFELEKSLC